jgi:hypothetical protein
LVSGKEQGPSKREPVDRRKIGKAAKNNFLLDFSNFSYYGRIKFLHDFINLALKFSIIAFSRRNNIRF